MNWLEYVEDLMGKAEKLIDSGYKPETGEMIFFPLCAMARTLAGIANAVESINEKMDTDKMDTEKMENLKLGDIIGFFDIEDLKDLLEELEEKKAQGILIDFEKKVITVMDTMEEEPKHEPGTAEADGPRSEKETSGET